MTKRESAIKRKTEETEIEVYLNLDGRGETKIDTGVPFFDHMLDLLSKHGLFDLTVKAKGDLEVDAHHTVEDVGICLGQAFRQSLGDKKGIARFGFSIVPMDEALALVSLDISGRPHLIYDVELPIELIGSFDTSLAHEFLHALVNHSAVTLHIKLLSGRNAHHIIEAIFKALAKAMSMAVSLEPRRAGEVPSTKGKI
ncbi:MAG TPA: imidazoleglycerol-phosphate dehydratase HisB [Actinobacteria bacterium]|nr:imidazoleglycerol-phosphate dehydratase HisB [Actinomycetota bacterium]